MAQIFRCSPKTSGVTHQGALTCPHGLTVCCPCTWHLWLPASCNKTEYEILDNTTIHAEQHCCRTGALDYFQVRRLRQGVILIRCKVAGHRLIDPPLPWRSFREEAQDFWSDFVECCVRERGQPGSRAAQHKRY